MTDTAARTRAKRNALLRSRGIPGFVPAPPVAAHLHPLLDAGWSRARIAERAGVDRRTVHGLLKAERPSLRHRTAQRLLALHPGRTDPKVPAVGSMRRLRALARLGWPLTASAAGAGISHPYARDIAAGRVRRVSRPVADAIAAMFDARSMRPGPMPRVATRAKANGWAPPMAWDDIDDPAQRPRGIAASCASRGCADIAAAVGLCKRCYRRQRTAAEKVA